MTHHCHAIACTTAVPPRMLMCRRHWAQVPKDLQRAVWAAYRHGQEDYKRPSHAWHLAATEAIAAVFRLELEATKVRQLRAVPQLELFGGRRAGKTKAAIVALGDAAGVDLTAPWVDPADDPGDDVPDPDPHNWIGSFEDPGDPADDHDG
jgi:hypothetical protein